MLRFSSWNQQMADLDWNWDPVMRISVLSSAEECYYVKSGSVDLTGTLVSLSNVRAGFGFIDCVATVYQSVLFAILPDSFSIQLIYVISC